MPFRTALIWGIVAAGLATILLPYWADKFKIDISGKTILILFPVVLIAATLYNIFAPDKLWTITTIIGLAIVAVSLVFHQIWRLVDKWRS